MPKLEPVVSEIHQVLERTAALTVKKLTLAKKQLSKAIPVALAGITEGAATWKYQLHGLF